MRHRIARIAPALALVALVAVGARADDDGDVRARPFMIRDTNSAKFAVSEAQRALDVGETLRGLREAQRVLDEFGEDYILVEHSDASDLWRPAPEVVRDLLARLNPDQRKTYEAMAAPSVGPLLDRAARLRDPAALETALSRYGLSPAGVAAGRLLAEIDLEDGRPRDAAHALSETLRFAPRDGSLWARLVDALEAAEAADELAGLRIPDDVLGPTDGGAESLRARLATARDHVRPPPPSADWPMWGGTPSHDRNPATVSPRPENLRWREPTEFMGRERDVYTFFQGPNDFQGDYLALQESFRPLFPAVGERTAYVSDGRSLRALDLYSGRPLWVLNGATDPTRGLLRPGALAHGRTSVERPFAPSLWRDLAVATLEIDRYYEPETLQGVEISTYLPRRGLFGVDRARGEVRWVAGENSDDRAALSDVSIISEPVVAEDLVLAVGAVHRHYYETYFLAFEASTGRLRWKRTLGWGNQELNLFGYPVKEISASAVAVSEGVAYASTGLGSVAAVDVRTGAPRWVASYDVLPITPVEYWFKQPLRVPFVAPSPPIVHGNVVLVAPTDGLHLLALDRRTGRLLWRYPWPRILSGRSAYVVGVASAGGRDVVLVTGSDLAALDMKTGAVAWWGRLDPERSRVVGKGAIAGGQVLVPTDDGLQRFSIAQQLKFEGRDPWPEKAEPGNVIPVGQVLLVTTRESVQWFYSWDDVEKDVARRRRARPDDPTILLEAGELYLRAGGGTDRARTAFREALRVSADSDSQLAKRARRGIFLSWRDEGDRDRATLPERATLAYRHALEEARTPPERVEARIRLDGVLGKDAEARAKNLRELVVEAEEEMAVFDRADGEIPAKAGALLRLSEVEADRGRVADAVDVLQRLLSEEGDVPLPDGQARDVARDRIAVIVKAGGPSAYRHHEERARALLEEARGSEDPALLDRILREYPNASVVPAALLERAERWLLASRPREAVEPLRRLLSESPASPLVPTALAHLSRAYGALGASGARRAALTRLERLHPDASFVVDGRDVTGASFAAAERSADGAVAARPPVPLEPPLSEVAFEKAGDEEPARAVLLQADPGVDLPVALFMRGRTLVCLDLEARRVGFTLDAPSCQRALLSADDLVLALYRELRDVCATDGAERWSFPLVGSVQDALTSEGIVFAIVSDQTRPQLTRMLLAVDAHQGTLLWSRDLGPDQITVSGMAGDRLLLRRLRMPMDPPTDPLRVSLLVVDGFTGTSRREIPLPLSAEGQGVAAGDLFLVASRPDAGARPEAGKRTLKALNLGTGATAWSRPLQGQDIVCAMVPEDDHVVVLQGDGSLTTYSLATGANVHETQVYAGDGIRACPFPETEMLLDPERVTLLPWATGQMQYVFSFDRRTGKLAWESRFESSNRVQKAALVRSGGVICAMVSSPDGDDQRIVVRLIDAGSGRRLQQIEPDDLSRSGWPPTLTAGRGSLVIVGNAGASLYAPSTAPK